VNDPLPGGHSQALPRPESASLFAANARRAANPIRDRPQNGWAAGFLAGYRKPGDPANHLAMPYHCLWPEVQMLHLVVSWFVSALALWLVAQIIPGIRVRDFGAALVATIVIAIVNATIGPVLKFLTFPLTFLTLGLFLLVVNALLLKLASLVTPGFAVYGFWSAVAGSLVLTILTAILRHIVFLPGREWTHPLWNTW
jgi:putative membrane protein